ncbi:MAG: DUF4392 domain-containing protein [Candidatus Limiplasma sp.]|nr:DUF4392 domain-containing protein [Candidatus Limiplasma sp.]
MDKAQLMAWNIGENLDQLMNLDPRGYGICRILYAGSRAYAGAPLTLRAADQLLCAVRPGDVVYIITGFVLLPHKMPETDGLVGSMLLARALVMALDATPILVCPEECACALQACATSVGLHLYQDLPTAIALPMSMGCVFFPKEADAAAMAATALLGSAPPAAAIAVEAPGANALGVYHNAAGLDVSRLEAKSDVLWTVLQQRGVPTVAIGDLGNEIGMGAIHRHILDYVPRTGIGECQCGCKGGILAATGADAIITATCSDWGCYGLIAMLAYRKGRMDILHTDAMEAETLRTASRCGMVDMDGSLVPGIDGFDTHLIVGVLSLMRQCTAYALLHDGKFDPWYAEVLGKPFHQNMPY